MTIEIIIDGQPLSELPGRVDRVEQAQLDMAELVGSKVDLASQSAASAAQRAVDVSARVDDLEELVATLKQALDSSDTTPPVDPPVVDPPVVTPPKPQPPSGTAPRLPAHLRGIFMIHGEQWPTYHRQVAKLDPTLAGRLAKYNFGTVSNRRSRFDTAPTGWTTGDTLDLMSKQWNTNLFGYKLQLPTTDIDYKNKTATTPIPVAAWRTSHPKHGEAKTWLTQFGNDIRRRQQANELVDPLPITILHENLGSYPFVLGHTVTPRSKEWTVQGSTPPHTPTDYGMFFRFVAETIRAAGAKILAIYSPNAVKSDDDKRLAAECVGAIGHEYLDAYGMSAYPHSQQIMASAEGYDLIGVNPSPFQRTASLEHQCEWIRTVTDAPIMVNEFGFNPTREHRNDQGKLVTTNAAPVEHLIPDYFQTAARFDIGQLWYFNADKIGGKEAFDILDDGNGTQHKPGTAQILVQEARKWSDKVRS